MSFARRAYKTNNMVMFFHDKTPTIEFIPSAQHLISSLLVIHPARIHPEPGNMSVEFRHHAHVFPRIAPLGRSVEPRKAKKICWRVSPRARSPSIGLSADSWREVSHNSVERRFFHDEKANLMQLSIHIMFRLHLWPCGG